MKSIVNAGWNPDGRCRATGAIEYYSSRKSLFTMSVKKYLWIVPTFAIFVMALAWTTKETSPTQTRRAPALKSTNKSSAVSTITASLSRPTSVSLGARARRGPIANDIDTGPTLLVSPSTKKGSTVLSQAANTSSTAALREVASAKSQNDRSSSTLRLSPKVLSPIQVSTSKSLVLEMALFLFFSDHHQYPSLLEELTDGDPNYLRAAATLRGVSLHDSSEVKPPDGYRWFYDRTPDGKVYLLGLTPKDQLSMAIDPSMPILCSLEQTHPSLIKPGKPAKAMILRYRERWAKSQVH